MIGTNASKMEVLQLHLEAFFYLAVLTTVTQVIDVYGCMNSANFENPQKDKSFESLMIANHSVQSPTECLWQCLANQQCMSFNFADASSSGSHVCELSDQTNSSKPSDYHTRPGFIYYGPDITKQYIEKCSRPQDCGSEMNSEGSGITCQCRKDYIGKSCNVHSGVKSCKELKDLGAPDGVYNIKPDGLGIITVYCDQTTDGGGWTVFQRRLSPFSLSFNRGWGEYQQGFGDVNGELWFGNDNIYRLTAAAGKEFRIDLTASGSHHGYAKYSGFQVANSVDKYRWTMSSYSGNIGNSIYGASASAHKQVNMRFSTTDQDNDGWPGGNCANNAGWWMNWCGYANLNSLTKPHWSFWSYNSATIQSEMKIR